MMSDNQTQKAGNNSRQIQAQSIIINNGIEEKRAREIFHEMFDIARKDLTQEANEIAQNNADNSNFDSARLDQALVEIKQELAEIKQNQGSAATAEQVEQVVQDAL